uniref:Sucrose nonfermenting 4-like protein n=1 Tax=Anthurium amnicola TaxID=1678845 RepID=A0A1D1Z217_9ARAE
MLPSGADAPGDAGAVLIPVRFVWPHGGRKVFLTGSFTGWSERLVAMSPMEGCPTVFQVICGLSPGSHQYKFYVDGEWRYDERQISVTGKHGTVNTWLLDPTSPISGLESATGRMFMDVDDEISQHGVTVAGGDLQVVTPRTLDADIDVSRHRISVFLTTCTAYDLLPDSGKVIALDSNLPVKQAFHILYEQGIPVAPLWDFYRGQFVGMLSALDFILILRELGNHCSNLTEEELERHTISSWKEGKQQLQRQVDGLGRPSQKKFVYAGPFDTLKDIAMRLLQYEVATIPIVHSFSQDGSFPQLLHLASLSEILKCICRHFRHSSSSLPILQQPIGTFLLGTWVPKIRMLRPNASLCSALSLLVQAQVSSIPIVDDNDSLLDIYSRSDITALAKDKAYARIDLNQMSIHQALQLGQDASSPFGIFNGQRCQMCLRSDTLQKVMERLANPGVRRIILVEAGSKRVEGIISLSDIFRFLLDWL